MLIMRKVLLIASALLCLAASAALAQTYRSEAAVRALQEDRTRAGNNLNSYEFPVIKDTKPPRGYKPFYISHYSRHGSRYYWNEMLYPYDKERPMQVVPSWKII